MSGPSSALILQAARAGGRLNPAVGAGAVTTYQSKETTS